MNYWKLLILLVFSSPAFADNDELMKCRQINDAGERLACFDGYVDKNFLTVEQIKQESVAVAAISKSATNKLTITLDNGQVWRQIDSTKLRLKVGDTVIIRAKSFGSFKLSKETGNRSIRVKRLVE
ncbi:MAG: hypothetical protein AAFN50_01220 [Pseudomonadota bacterium]